MPLSFVRLLLWWWQWWGCRSIISHYVINCNTYTTEAGADDGINMIEASGLLLCCLQTRTGVKFVITWVVYFVWTFFNLFFSYVGMERYQYICPLCHDYLPSISCLPYTSTKLTIYRIHTNPPKIARNQEHATPNKYSGNYTSSTRNAHWKIHFTNLICQYAVNYLPMLWMPLWRGCRRVVLSLRVGGGIADGLS